MTRGRPAARPAGEEGGASVLVIGIVAAVVAVLAGVLAVAAAAHATHAMRAAADLAALAGATRRQAGANPALTCAVVEEAAARNGAEDVDCRVEGDVVQVRASRRLHASAVLPLGLSASATARAGPGGGGPGPGPGDYHFATASG